MVFNASLPYAHQCVVDFCSSCMASMPSFLPWQTKDDLEQPQGLRYRRQRCIEENTIDEQKIWYEEENLVIVAPKLRFDSCRK